MNVKIFTAILCPAGESPTTDNCKSVNVVATDLVDAVNVATRSEDMPVVSVSLTSEAIISGTIVDFE